MTRRVAVALPPRRPAPNESFVFDFQRQLCCRKIVLQRNKNIIDYILVRRNCCDEIIIWDLVLPEFDIPL